MKSIKTSLIFAGLVLSAISCKPDLEVPAHDKGSLDLSRYVAFGNSLTAGYADGGLYLESQQNSYPNILAGQFKLAGGGEFEQPLFDAGQYNGSGYLYLSGFNGALPSVKTITEKPGFSTASLAYTGSAGANGTLLLAPYTVKTAGQITPQNIGVPGIKLAEVFDQGYGFKDSKAFNPYFERMQPGNQSYAEYAAKSNPTFFTCWLGNNDVLSYALAGGDLNGDGNTDPDGMTATDVFETTYHQFLDGIRAGNPNAKGLLSNLPDVSTIPNFTTISVTLAVVQAKQTNPLVQGLFIQITPDSVRQADDRDLIPLTTQGVIGRMDTIDIPNVGPTVIPHGFSTLNPLRNNEILDRNEVASIATRTAQLNQIIANVATAYDLALWDANTYLKKIQATLYFEGVKVNSAFISGNAFSLDGVHLTPMGYAIAANQMIGAINTKYKTAIPTVSITHYRSVKFPD